MLLQVVLFIAGVALLVKGSDFFVDASVAIARRANIPRVIIGGTLVSLATTTPEMTVSVISGIDHVPGLAIGNAMGSVAVNIGFVLAVAALIRTVTLSPKEFLWRSWVMLSLVVVVFLMTLDLDLPRWRGVILLGVGVGYLVYNYYRSRHSRTAADTTEIAEPPPKLTTAQRITFYFLLGLAMVIVGSRLVVSSGIAISEALGVPTIIIGLTIVAIGTSLPELATAITASRKRVSDLSAGNLIGANILNLTLVTGVASTVSPLQLDRTTQLYTFPAVLVILGVFFFFVRSRNHVSREEGIVLIALYAAFLAGLAIVNM